MWCMGYDYAPRWIIVLYKLNGSSFVIVGGTHALELSVKTGYICTMVCLIASRYLGVIRYVLGLSV